MPDASPSSQLLVAQNLCKSFGGVQAIDQVSITVPQGTVTGLIGPNGAGKTTLFNLLSNTVVPDRGQVYFNNQPLHSLLPHQVAQRGLVRTFQTAKVLSRLSVLENMLLAAHPKPKGQTGENLWNVWLQPRKIQQQERHLKAEALAILESVGLGAKAGDYAGSLSGGQQKLLEMARTLMVKPQLILLDEPAAGVNPALVEQICQYILTWNQQGMTFLIIEHNMDVVMSICDRVWVMAEGRNLMDGSPQEVQTHPLVLEAYLGD
jgi:neutral amino acid transport system ATP-binding protein